MVKLRKIPFRSHGKKPAKQTAALTLVQAIYPTTTIGELVLKFDRAIDISAFDGTQIIVKDGLLLEARCDGTGPVIQADAQTVQIFLVALDDYFEPNDLLDASGATGIVAVEDGAEWAGVSELALPFP